jgi:hypothetical protein
MTYPKQVNNTAEYIFEAFTDFMIEENIDPTILREEICKNLLPKFIQGIELTFTEDEILEVMKYAHVNTLIEGLKAKGLINSIEDENGQEWLWATTSGKEALEEHKKTKHKKRKPK